MYDQCKNETELAAKVMLRGWPSLKHMLITAYALGYENGHHDTVEGRFSGCGRIEDHFEEAEDWIVDNLEIFE